MFRKKISLDDIEPLVNELKEYLNSKIAERINSGTMHYDRKLMNLDERIRALEKKKKGGLLSFEYIETGLNIDQAIDRLSRGMAMRNHVFRDDVYIVAKFESHVKSIVVGYSIISLLTNKILGDFSMIPKGECGCLNYGWSVIELIK